MKSYIKLFISVYFARCSFLFWISTEAKRTLGFDEKQTVKSAWKMTERKSKTKKALKLSVAVRGRGICQDLLPHTPGA